MLLRAAHLAPGGCVARAWRAGAYSDDLILAALAGELGLRVLCPGVAAFPAHGGPGGSPGQAWNYLRRQLFVLDTYTSPHNRCGTARKHCTPTPFSCACRRVNHALLAVTVLAATALLAPLPAVAWHLSALLLRKGTGCPTAQAGALCYAGLVGAAGLGARRMYRQLYALCSALSPSWEAVCPTPFHALPWMQIVLALFAVQAALLLCAVRMAISASVTWAGVHYTRRHGLVTSLRSLHTGQH